MILTSTLPSSRHKRSCFDALRWTSVERSLATNTRSGAYEPRMDANGRTSWLLEPSSRTRSPSLRYRSRGFEEIDELDARRRARRGAPLQALELADNRHIEMARRLRSRRPAWRRPPRSSRPSTAHASSAIRPNCAPPMPASRATPNPGPWTGSHHRRSPSSSRTRPGWPPMTPSTTTTGRDWPTGSPVWPIRRSSRCSCPPTTRHGSTCSTPSTPSERRFIRTGRIA